MSEMATILDREQDLLAEIVAATREEAAAAARKMKLTQRYSDLRSDHPAAAPDADFDPESARRSAIAEVALATATSFTTVQGWVRTASTVEQYIELRKAFAAGEISTAQIRTVLNHTAATPSALVASLEPTLVAAARRLAPRPLGVEIDRLLLDVDPEAADRAAERAQKCRRVTSQRMPHGMGAIRTVLTATETTEIWTALRQTVNTVCALDHRPIEQRYADAYVALMRGHTALTCTCDRDECTARHHPLAAGPEVQLSISCDVDTLLGIGSTPAVLEGYGCLDACMARELAKDATWQAIIHAAERLDNSPTPSAITGGLAPQDVGAAAMAANNPLLATAGRPAVSPAQHAAIMRERFGIDTTPAPRPNTERHSDFSDIEDISATSETPSTGYPLAPKPPITTATARAGRDSGRSQGSGCAVNTGRDAAAPAVTVARTRRLPAGAVFDTASRHTGRPSQALWHKVIDSLQAQADRAPDSLRAWDLTGHGGFQQPPPGALTYTPSAALTAAARLRDATCRHPGCTTPATACQIDHIVPFRHSAPAAGGWSVLANLQCLCRLHHQLKTTKQWSYEMLGLGIVHTWNTHGQHAFSLPGHRAAIPSGTGAF